MKKISLFFLAFFLFCLVVVFAFQIHYLSFGTDFYNLNASSVNQNYFFQLAHRRMGRVLPITLEFFYFFALDYDYGVFSYLFSFLWFFDNFSVFFSICSLSFFTPLFYKFNFLFIKKKINGSFNL